MKHNRFFLFISVFTILLFIASCQKSSDVVSPDLSKGSSNVLSKSSNGIVFRDINDFLSTQTISISWYDPDDPIRKMYICDYAGVLKERNSLNINSTYTGIITEKALGDGTAEVRIRLKAHNILTYVTGVTGSSWTPVLFGENPTSVLGGATPTLGEANLDVTFTNSAPGAPIPELWYMSIRSYSTIYASAFGPFKEEAGFGPDGTPGHAWMNQIGLLAKIGDNGNPGVDGFAVEFVKLQPVGIVD
jgi:hypothetical protein